MSYGQSFGQALPYPMNLNSNEQALASVLVERFVPANTTTVLTVKNQIIPGFEQVFKNGLLLDFGGTPAYVVSGKKLTLTVAANGTDIFLVRYYFRAGV